MSRTGRLFLLMDALRCHRRPVTAARLAEQLGVSERTIYRDVQTLCGLGAPLEGEAGVGYMLKAGFFLPPLMFGADEIEALVLGARWVKRQGDEAVALAANSALAKIDAATPKDLSDDMAEISLWVTAGGQDNASHIHVRPLREAIRYQHRLRVAYRDEKGAESERMVWPFALAFFDGRRLLAAWCELRAAFRHFRIDRIAAVESTGERYPARRHELLKSWRREHDIPEDS